MKWFRNLKVGTKLVLGFTVMILFIAIIGLTGMQRVYVGVHWPSDSLGGFLFGGLLLALLIWGHRRLRSLPVGAWLLARAGRGR